MDRIVEKTLLYDFYGELLTERQKEIYEEVVMNDMSFSEAAAEYGISRQGIHDMIRRVESTLSEYEDRLHMVSQFEKIRSIANEMQKTLSEAETVSEKARMKLLSLTAEILTEIE